MESIPTTTVETNVSLAEGMIEYHINNMHHAEKFFGNRHLIEDLVWENFENMSWCCEHSPVEGTVEISLLSASGKNVQQVSVPVLTNFGVVCTREKEQDYKITWSYSLS